jgi:hypothetical protein
MLTARTSSTYSVVLVALLCADLASQTPIELSVNNQRRVVQGTHPTTTNYYPATVTVPAEYSSPTGVPAGLRTYSYTPTLRAQGGHVGNDLVRISGMTMAIFTGAAVATFPAPNHYQFRCGVAPAAASARPRILQHAPTGADLFVIADAPVVITTWAIVEHTVTLTTPAALPLGSELLLFAEYRGGEYREDPNGGQALGSDWQGGNGPTGILEYQGHTRGTNPRTVTPYTSFYRPKLGLIVEEPILTATGYHANSYYGAPTFPMPNEDYRGLAACYADWSSNPNSTLFFDIRAGDAYGSGAAAVVFLNVEQTLLPYRFPLGAMGNLLLNPNDPAFAILAGLQFQLLAGGVHQGPANPILVPPLGIAARGLNVKAQGFVFTNSLSQYSLTSASAIEIY